MSRRDDAAAAEPQASEAQVLAYLRAHPDFLIRHPDIAVRLAPPARVKGDGVADLQQFMIERLRHDLDEMRGCAEHLISTTRSNMSIQSRTHQAALAALSARDMAEMVQVLGDLPALLDVEVVALAFEAAAGVIPDLSVAGIQRLPAGFVDRALDGAGREVALRASSPGAPEVFGAGAGLVRSYALVRLEPGERRPAGLLGLGGRQERSFHAGQGTELLVFLARVVQHAVARWVG